MIKYINGSEDVNEIYELSKSIAKRRAYSKGFFHGIGCALIGAGLIKLFLGIPELPTEIQNKKIEQLEEINEDRELTSSELSRYAPDY